NNADRPPVFAEGTSTELYPGGPLPHFNEVDECAGVDELITNRCWNALGFDPSTTLHDVRWGEHYKGASPDGGSIDDFVWVLQISGAAPANHFAGGYAGARSERQPAMYFPLGGGSLKGVSKPGEIVWSRVFVEGGALHVDLGRGTAVSLPETEAERRWKETTRQWPLMHAILHGVSQNQLMARHRANHVNVAYAPDGAAADKALAVKAAMFAELGVQVHLCGVTQAAGGFATAAAELSASR
ncbi:MAG: fucose isomerase, partial [Candidatus Binataceae bacterium]